MNQDLDATRLIQTGYEARERMHLAPTSANPRAWSSDSVGRDNSKTKQLTQWLTS